MQHPSLRVIERYNPKIQYPHSRELNYTDPSPNFNSMGFPEFRQILMGPWNTGPSHGVLLDEAYYNPGVVTLLPSFQINPRLSATPSCEGGYIHWDVTQPASTAQFFGENETLSFEEFCDEPATAPRLPKVELISRSFHWVFNAHARDVVTVGEVLKTLYRSLSPSMRYGYLEELSEEHQASAWRGYWKRCPNGDEEKYQCPRLFDILEGNTMFGGLLYDREYEEERKFDEFRWKIHLLVTYLPGDI